MPIIKQITNEKGGKTNFHTIKCLSYYPDFNKIEVKIAHYVNKNYHDKELEDISNRSTYIELNNRISDLSSQIYAFNDKIDITPTEKAQKEKLEKRLKSLVDILPKYKVVSDLEYSTSVFVKYTDKQMTIKEVEQAIIADDDNLKGGEIVNEQ